jgi:hypothetical protein
MKRRYILDAEGEPVACDDLHAWARWMATNDRGVVARDESVPGVLVSTVFLGVDHSHLGGPPVLWETMIFGFQNDKYQERYTSKADALAGHALALGIARGSPP